MPELGGEGSRSNEPARALGVTDRIERPERPAAKRRVGQTRGRKQEVPLHLPQTTFDALSSAATAAGVSRGVAVMRALRAAYPDLARELATTAEPVGPFPAERRSRRRVRVDHPVRTSVIVWPDEAAALVRVADELDLSCSELVTLALDRHLQTT